MRSIAPSAARMPYSIWAPSKAGPVGVEVQTRPLRLPAINSALVPMSMISRFSSCRCGSSAIATAMASAPTKLAAIGSTWTLAAGLAPGYRERGPARRVARVTVGTKGTVLRFFVEMPEEEMVHRRVADHRHLVDIDPARCGGLAAAVRSVSCSCRDDRIVEGGEAVFVLDLDTSSAT